jgi:hypothetical protein
MTWKALEGSKWKRGKDRGRETRAKGKGTKGGGVLHLYYKCIAAPAYQHAAAACQRHAPVICKTKTEQKDKLGDLTEAMA